MTKHLECGWVIVHVSLCLVLLLFFREQRINDNTLMQANNDNPVLNNPYEEPQYYYDTDMNGNIDYATVINGRRPFGYDVNIVPKKRGEKTLYQLIPMPSLSMASVRR